MTQTFEQYLKANPIIVPETACGHYVDVARLMKFWDWSSLVCQSLMAGEKVPSAIVAQYLEQSKVNALPPNRRADYPELAARFPICYERQADGSMKLV